ncbi:Alpha/Beta hydrolase protein [Hygrophoropsis aurantiaca]|uniref:Alpha/Beta hydrolase protein n=1 Tax=Hygrophoropsis aurantiaca TaxID=72124 RepID=A0ACB8A174_9AGAM|nr:Alpha/Beta hydrolase protein [Hygrophoropsis aurantiaca]
MNPADPDSFSHRTERLSTGRTYHFVDQLPTNYDVSRPTLLCLHGFPDLWYGWRHQIGPWTRKGYRVIVPDMLGYGQTDMPSDAAAYSTKKLCDDLAALLDLVNIPKAVVIGHDWGSFAAGRFALWYPARVLGLIMMSVPYTPPSIVHMPVETMAERYANFGYQVYFADNTATTEIESNLATFFRLLFRKPNKTISWAKMGELKALLTRKQNTNLTNGCLLTDEQLDYYVSQYSRGILGPLSYYRTTKIRYEEEKGKSTFTYRLNPPIFFRLPAGALPTVLGAKLPVLCLYGTEDETCPPSSLRNAHKFIPQLQDVALDGAGHWILLEAKDIVTEETSQWVDSLLRSYRTNRL